MALVRSPEGGPYGPPAPGGPCGSRRGAFVVWSRRQQQLADDFAAGFCSVRGPGAGAGFPNPETHINRIGEAVWWSITTITTVGHGDLAPVSPIGRLIAVLLMNGGISLLGSITATLASWIVQRLCHMGLPTPVENDQFAGLEPTQGGQVAQHRSGQGCRGRRFRLRSRAPAVRCGVCLRFTGPRRVDHTVAPSPRTTCRGGRNRPGLRCPPPSHPGAPSPCLRDVAR